MRILVTNDDGIESSGLQTLAASLERLGDVMVVAPATDMTAVSRGITISGAITVDEVDLRDGRLGYAVAGTPADCVRFALHGLPGPRPVAVVSGINRGANLGDDISYSGTVAAAFEGLLNGLPSLAFSQQAMAGDDWSLDARFDYRALADLAPRLLGMVLEHGLPEGTLLTVNGPGLPADEVRGVRVAPLGRRVYPARAEVVGEEQRRRHYRLYGEPPSFHADDGTDFAAVAGGYISVTPLHYDLTDRDAFATLRGWGLEEIAPA